MAFFELNSDITIGNFRFSGVHDVQIKRSMHGIVDTAVIKIPSKGRITKNKKVGGEEIITGKQFNDGDHVTIKLGYNGDLKTEFMGFVKRRNLNMPMEVECEGYSWLLRRTSAKAIKTTTTIKKLLENAVKKLYKGYHISVQCDVDITLVQLTTNNKTAFDMINYISEATDGAITCFFIQPDKLWCGLSHTAYANFEDKLNIGKAEFRTGFNTPRENSLKERVTDDDLVQVKFSKVITKGKEISQTSDVYKDFVHEHPKVLNQLDSEKALKILANEKAYKLSYKGYEGSITGFLQPYVTPGYKVFIKHPQDNKIQGTYLAESVQVNFGVKGARRIIEIGPKMGFAK